MGVPAHPSAHRGTLHVPPERWTAIDTRPADLSTWRDRLGGGPGAFLAVQGAINRGRLHRLPGGLYAPPAGQLPLL